MPRATDYNNCTIYHIRNINSKQVIYVGSSSNYLKRKSKHKWDCNTEKSDKYNNTLYQYIRSQGGYNLFEVIPVKFLKLENGVQLRIEEQKEMDKYDSLQNKIDSIMTSERREEYHKEYYIKNKKTLKEKHKEYNKKKYEEIKNNTIMCECGCIVQSVYLKRHLITRKHLKLV